MDRKVQVGNRQAVFLVTNDADPVIAEIVKHIESMCPPHAEKHTPSVFDLNRASVDVTMEEYVLRTVRYARVCKPEIYTTLLFMNKVHALKRFIFTGSNVYKLWLACLLLAEKVLDDRCPTNTFFAKTGGIKVGELNTLECALLQMIEFETGITDSQFADFAATMDTRVESRACAKEKIHTA